ncbi:hypothetical protein FRC00_001664 [Tulasnella sp. 408]|nr:hypothetical protein FRC00_001664 [Tulasnella sp. 408]
MDDEHRKPAGCPSIPAVLSISEILVCIFRELGNGSRAAAARVCRTWVDVALDVLWEDLESPLPIMKLLGRTGYYGCGLDWETGSPNGDWTRFASYMRRVRAFSCDGGIGIRRDEVLAELLHYVAKNHGTYLLPQIRRLRWRVRTDDDVRTISPFLSPTLREVEIRLRWEVSSSATYRLLRTLHTVPLHNMAPLQFGHNGRTENEFEEELASTINIQSKLRVLRIPAFPIETPMLVPNLRVLQAKLDPAWNADPGAFFLQLSDKCPLIENLRIIFPSDSMLTVESIRPLLRYSKLWRLDLEYPGAVDMQDKHIEEMVSAWREMEVLHIAARRAHVDPVAPPSGTPIASLATFAQAFSPKLRKLAVYFNASDVLFLPDPPVRFANLEVFSVGASQLGYSQAEQWRVVRFLSAVLPSRKTFLHSESSSYNPSQGIFDFEGLRRRNASPGWVRLSEMLYDYRKECSAEELSYDR